MIRGRVFPIDLATQADPEQWKATPWAWEVTEVDDRALSTPVFVHLIDWGYSPTLAEAFQEASMTVGLLRLVQQR